MILLISVPYVPFGWRTVWILAMFDLPVITPDDRRHYARFRKNLLKDGFTMMQFSVYQRHCASTENAHVHISRMASKVPPAGEVRFLTITDNQFSKIQTFWGKKRKTTPSQPSQLEFF